jgi:hypothetical protein
MLPLKATRNEQIKKKKSHPPGEYRAGVQGLN